MASTVTAAGEQLVLAARAVVAQVAQPLNDDDLVSSLARVAEARRLLDGAVVRLASEIDARSTDRGANALTRRAGFRGASAMLADALGARASTTRQVLDVARTPARGIADAVLAGEATLEQAGAYLGGLGAAASQADDAGLALANQAFCEFATDDEAPASPERLAALGRYVGAHIDADALDASDERHRAERRFAIHRRDDGMLRVSALLTPEDGAVVQRVIDSIASPARRVVFDATAQVAFSDVDADAEARDERTMPQRRADAFTEVFAVHAASPGAATIGGAAPTLVITASLHDLAGHAGERLAPIPPVGVSRRMQDLVGERAGERASARLLHTDDIVPVEVAARMLCHANVQIARVSDAGDVMSLGRTTRLFTAAQRRALVIRDAHCRAPGCAIPGEWCEAHHVVWWQAGGRTDLSNGILLCRFHHGEVHTRRLVITAAPADAAHPFLVTSRRTRPARTSPHGAQRRQPGERCSTNDATGSRDCSSSRQHDRDRARHTAVHAVAHPERAP